MLTGYRPQSTARAADAHSSESDAHSSHPIIKNADSSAITHGTARVQSIHPSV